MIINFLNRFFIKSRIWQVLLSIVIFSAIIVSCTTSLPSTSSSDQSNLVTSSSSNTSVAKVSVVAVEVETLPTRTSYTPVDVVTTQGGVLRVIYSDYNIRYIPMNDAMIDLGRFNISTVGVNQITLKYQELDQVYYITYNINIVPFVVGLEKVSLDIENTQVIQGQSFKINLVIEPLNAYVGRVVWSSSNPLVASVDQNGLVNAKNLGEVTITVEIDETMLATSRLKVINKEIFLEQLIEPIDETPPVLSDLVLTFNSATSLTLDFETSEAITYYAYISNGPVLEVDAIIDLDQNLLITEDENALEITLTVTGTTFINNYHLTIFGIDSAGNVSNKLFSQLSNQPTLLSINDWLPIASITELALINTGAAAGTVYGAGTSFAYTLPSNLTSAQSLLKSYFLVNDLDFATTTTWTRIGSGSNFSNTVFRGSFDGQNKVISNYSVNEPLFGTIVGSLKQPWSIANSNVADNFNNFFGNFTFSNPNHSTIISQSSLIIGNADKMNIKNILADKLTGKLNTSTTFAIFTNLLTESLVENIVNKVSFDTTEQGFGVIFRFLSKAVLINVRNEADASSVSPTNNTNAVGGGIVGTAQDYAKFLNVSNSGEIISRGQAGGIIGVIGFGGDDGTTLILEKVSNLGNVFSGNTNGTQAGGLIGHNQGNRTNLTIKNSYNTGDIRTYNFDRSGGGAGGLIGRFNKNSNFTQDNILIENSYSIGSTISFGNVVNGGGIIGAIRGLDDASTLEIFNNIIFNNVYYNNANSVKVVGSMLNSASTLNDVTDKYEGKTINQLILTTTFKNFDFTNTWLIDNEVSTPTLNEEYNTINISSINGLTVPVTEATRVTSITTNNQFIGSVTWNPVMTNFAAGVIYTATVTLTPKAGYTFNGVSSNFFTVAGATSVANNANSRILIVVFPST